MNLTPQLNDLKKEIEEHARSYGLDFFEVVFELIDFDQMNEIASFGGFPTRYAHWKFGMEYERIHKGYTYGLQKIYEMVINNDVCYAYLLKSNNLVEQKCVMAHVYAHADFFKNNLWFSETNRNMVDETANHSTRIKNYVDRYGLGKVEGFIDNCLSIENLIDIHSSFIKRRGEKGGYDLEEEEQKTIKKIDSKDYMDSFINPPEFIEERKKRLEEEKEAKKKLPGIPEKDVLLFLLEHAPLENWQKDVLSIIREEACYFAPIGQTKIMNEGWAAYWHSVILIERILEDNEIIDYADSNAATLATRFGSINPYKLGVELFRDIEDRWNKGKFGKEYEECEEITKRKNWDMALGLGREKIFDVRTICNDIGFIDTFLTDDFCERQRLFTYEYNETSGMYEIASRNYKDIKDKLLFLLTNLGHPFIFVEDGNYKNRGELYLKHKHEGIDLEIIPAKDTLNSIYSIWQRPVHLETVVGGKPMSITYDGKADSYKGCNNIIFL